MPIGPSGLCLFTLLYSSDGDASSDCADRRVGHFLVHVFSVQGCRPDEPAFVMLRRIVKGVLMDGSTRVALGLVAAAAILSVSFVGYREYSRHRDIRDVQQFISSMDADVRASSLAAQRRAARRAVRERDLRNSRRLNASQRCIAGTVVFVRGSTYIQVTDSRSMPIPCTGRFAKVPIR